ncbi:hypothetical protein X743_04950 [Mesorhizobium sp. LNHC252B00]|nr:hypothetical protein X743_04950 [Mesorhizobium sp. LNHC252B00]
MDSASWLHGFERSLNRGSNTSVFGKGTDHSPAGYLADVGRTH